MIKNSLKFLFFLSIICFSAIYLVSCLAQFPYDEVEVLRGIVKLEVGRTTYLPLPKLNDEDRVMINLQTPATVDVKVVQDGENMTVLPVTIEGARYSLVDYLLNNQKALFIAKEGNINYLILHAPFPLTQYHVIFPLENTEEKGEMKISQITVDGYEMINVTITKNSAMFVYPINLTVNKDFKVKIKFLSLSNVKLKLNIMSDTDNMLYVYEVPLNSTYFEIDTTTEESYKRGSILGDRISSVSISIAHISKDIPASVIVGDMEILNAGKKVIIDAATRQSYEVPYEIYIAHKYSPSVMTLISWILLSVGMIAVWCLISDDTFNKSQVRK